MLKVQLNFDKNFRFFVEEVKKVKVKNKKRVIFWSLKSF